MSSSISADAAGQWLEEKHGAKSRRRWRKLHLVLDAYRGEIITHVMTDQDASDPSQVAALLDQIDIGQSPADRAYDGNPPYNAVTKHRAFAAVVMRHRRGTTGHRLRARSFAAQQIEVAIGCSTLKRTPLEARAAEGGSSRA